VFHVALLLQDADGCQHGGIGKRGIVRMAATRSLTSDRLEPETRMMRSSASVNVLERLAASLDLPASCRLVIQTTN